MDTRESRLAMFKSMGLEENPKKTKLLRELGKVDISELKKRVLALSEDDWDTDEDFALNGNKTQTLVSVKHINFRFNKGRKYQGFNCSNWDDWKDVLLPVMDAVAEEYGYKNRFYPIVMLALLPARHSTVPHTDGHPIKVNPHKIHIPIVTNENVYFELNHDKFYFEEGFAYEVNNIIRHNAVNEGKTDRIHLIFELIDLDAQSDLIKAKIAVSEKLNTSALQ